MTNIERDLLIYTVQGQNVDEAVLDKKKLNFKNHILFTNKPKYKSNK